MPRYGALRATLRLAIFGGIAIPLYELIGRFARYWCYQNTPLLLGVTPHYVILAEALMLFKSVQNHVNWRAFSFSALAFFMRP